MRGRGRAENPLLDLVRTGIENDFEQRRLSEISRIARGQACARTGWGAVCLVVRLWLGIYGLFSSRAAAEKAAGKLRRRRSSGAGDGHADPAAVLEEDFRLTISDCRFCGLGYTRRASQSTTGSERPSIHWAKVSTGPSTNGRLRRLRGVRRSECDAGRRVPKS